jgi:Gpi18-like mannosyltransferase
METNAGVCPKEGKHMNKNVADDALRGLMGRRMPAWARYALVLAATAVFAVFAYHARYAKIDEFTGFRMEEMTRLIAGVLAALYALTVAVELHIGRKLNVGAQALLCVVVGLILLAKVSLFDYVSDDYDIFLSNWIYEYSQMGIKQGLGTYIGSDYTPPYLYLLLLISRVKNYPWQYLVKAVSMAFEVLLAYSVTQLAGLQVRGAGKRVVIFNLTLMLPTVVFNGAYWGQCDVIYTSLCLTALYMALQKKSARSMILFGMALSFKLQTVFFLPALLPLWLRKDIKLRHLALIPAAYMAMMIPAFWGGKSLHHALTVYTAQASTYNFMTVNGPSLYNFLPASMDKGTLYTMFSGMAMALGMAMLAIVCLMVCLHREHITREGTLLTCLLVLGGVPFFLPKMHERYTFGADVLALAIAAYNPKRVWLPLLFGLSSYICYTAGLPGDAIFDLKWATVFQGAAVALTAAALYRSLNEEKAEAALAEVKA